MVRRAELIRRAGGDCTGTTGGETPETLLLNRNPGLRESVEQIPAFIAWRQSLHVVDLEDGTYYVARGDQLMTHDEIIVEWGRLELPNFPG